MSLSLPYATFAAESCTTSQISADEEEFRGIGGSSDTNVIAVGHDSPASFYHYDGSTWTKHADTSDKQLHDVSVVSDNLAYAVGHDGRIMHYDGSNWTIFSSPSTAYLTSIWANTDSDLWIVGKNSDLHHWDGSSWTDVSGSGQANIDSDEDLQDAWGNGNTFYTVEKDGDLYRYTNSTDSWDKFSACNSAFAIEAEALWSDGSGNVYIAGKNGNASVLKYNEGTNSCTEIATSNLEDKFSGIYGYGSTLYAVGKKGLVSSNISGSWVATQDAGVEDYKSVWVSDSSSAYYSAKKGVVTSCTNTIVAEPELTAIASYHMDKTSWDGSIGEIGDTSGNNYHGRAVNGATTQNTSPAIIGNPGTCAYGVFDGGDDYVELPNFPNLQNSFTITAWIKGESNANSIIFADDDNNQGGYALSLGSDGHGKLRFLSRDINPTTLDTGNIIPNKNKWYFVTAVHNASSKQRIIYVNGVAEASGTYTGTWGSDSGTASIGGETNASSEGANFAPFKGNIDEVQVFGQALNQSQIQELMLQTHPCDVIIEAANFNCVATNSNGITGRLYTKLANQDFNFDVVALQGASTIETAFANTVTVELVDSSSGDCGTHAAVSPELSQSLSFTAGSGIKTTADILSTQAYPQLKCRVTDSTSGIAVVACSADSFSIRPEAFTISSPLNSGTSSGSPTSKAGEDFSITATSDVANYNGTPVIDSTKVQAHASAIQTGTLSGDFNAADLSNGNSTGTTFTYDEVGNFYFDIEGVIDSNFTSIDSASGDCLINSSLNTENAEGKIGCNIANITESDVIGRFTPDHFEISSGSIINRINESCSPASNFTYTNEALQSNFTLIAKNSSNVTTQNYHGDFVKFDGSNPNNFNFSAVDSSSSTALSSQLSLVSSSCLWGASSNHGQGICTAKLGVISNATEGPYNAFQLGIAPSDSDGIILGSYNLDTTIPSDGNDAGLVATSTLRSGRLVISNAHGSELVELPVPLSIEYFNGLNWSVNTHDDCSSITLNDLTRVQSITNSITSAPLNTPLTATLSTARFSDGKNTLTLSEPGENNIGHVEITADLSSMPWLQFDWNGDGSFGDNPSGRASFGIYKGSKKLIFRREVY